MGNSITTVSKYLPYLDQVYAYGSRSSVLDTPGDLVRETADAKTVLFAKTSMDGLTDYSRDSGYTTGDVSLTWESHTLTHDRGRSFQIDAMDDAETLGIAFGSLASEFIRTKVVSEVDATRFAQYAQKAGTIKAASLSSSDVVTAIDAAITAMKEKEVDLTGAYLFVTPTLYTAVKESSAFSRPLSPSENPNRNFGSFDELTVVEVPQTRFYKAVTLGSNGYTATSTGTTASFTGDASTKKFTVTAKPNFLDGVTVDGTAKTLGTDYTYDAATGEIAFTTAPAASKAIVATYGKGTGLNFLIVAPSAVVQITKRAKLRIFDPDTNQSADAYKVDYRIYHDAWALDNKIDGIYAHVKTA